MKHFIELQFIDLEKQFENIPFRGIKDYYIFKKWISNVMAGMFPKTPPSNLKVFAKLLSKTPKKTITKILTYFFGKCTFDGFDVLFKSKAKIKGILYDSDTKVYYISLSEISFEPKPNEDFNLNRELYKFYEKNETLDVKQFWTEFLFTFYTKYFQVKV